MSRALSDPELLAHLVSFDSTSHKSNLPIAEFICDYLDDPRIEIARNYNGDQTKVNLVVRLAPRASDHSPADGQVEIIRVLLLIYLELGI